MLLGANYVGQEALIRFYVLHVAVLPVAIVALMGVHMWRVRKDGGLSRDESAPPLPARMEGRDVKVFEPTKTYGLMAIVKGRTPVVNRSPEGTVPSWPNLMWAEVAVFMLTVAVTVVLGYYFDAPLKEAANPAIPENPAKAPWYFLGLQELVSYSAFMGGVGIPGIVLLGLGLIPYIDRDPHGVGQWFGGKQGKRVFLASLSYGFASVLALLACTVNFGWLRTWFPTIPQIVIIVLNPGTVIVALYVAWSLWELRRTGSMRMSAIALFTCFLAGFIVLTAMGSIFRGPNWHFYWWPSQWPVH